MVFVLIQYSVGFSFVNVVYIVRFVIISFILLKCLVKSFSVYPFTYFLCFSVKYLLLRVSLLFINFSGWMEISLNFMIVL